MRSFREAGGKKTCQQAHSDHQLRHVTRRLRVIVFCNMICINDVLLLWAPDGFGCVIALIASFGIECTYEHFDYKKNHLTTMYIIIYIVTLTHK